MAVERQERDSDLVAAARSGDREAFAALYDRHFPAIYDFLVRLLRNRTDAADITQDSFVRAMERLDQLETPERFRSWLFSIAYRLGLNRIEQRKRTGTLIAEEDEIGSEVLAQIDPARLDDPAQAAEARETASLVWEIAEGLDERSYAALDLHVRQGLPSGEIAEALGVSKSNAYAIVSRMKKTLADSIGTYLLVRRGSTECESLSGLLSNVRVPPVDSEIRRMVNTHVESCETCQKTRRRLLVPATLFSALSVVPAPTGLQTSIWEGVAGGTLAGAAAAGGAAGGSGGGGSGWATVGEALKSPAGIAATVGVGVVAAAASMWLALGGTDGGAEPQVLSAGLEQPAPPPATTVAAPTVPETSPAPSIAPSTTALIEAGPDPGDVVSSSHRVGTASTEPVVVVEWTPLQGARGYSVSWTAGANDLPDRVVDLPGDASGTTSPPLAPGSWWFHLRTQGGDGNWSSTVHLGPFLIEPPPPTTSTSSTTTTTTTTSIPPQVLVANVPPTTSTTTTIPVIPTTTTSTSTTTTTTSSTTSTTTTTTTTTSTTTTTTTTVPPSPPEITGPRVSAPVIREQNQESCPPPVSALPEVVVVTAGVSDPDGVATVTLSWIIFNRQGSTGSKPMDYDPSSQTATTDLSFGSDAVTPSPPEEGPASVAVTLTVTASDGQGNEASAGRTITLFDCSPTP